MASDAVWWHRLGWAAAVALLVGVGFSVRQGDEAPVLRGGTPSSTAGAATWLVEDPRPAAAALAADLRTLGAAVDLLDAPEGVSLRIHARADAQAAVQQRLLALEAGLNAEGRATVLVRQRR